VNTFSDTLTSFEWNHLPATTQYFTLYHRKCHNDSMW